MDRFKFRVWSAEEKSYDHKFPFNTLGIFYIAETGRLFSDFGNSVAPELHEDRFVVEQCTGLKDKNGNLIYEGDIVRFEIVDADSALGKTFERICEICFGKGDYPYSFVCKNDAYCRGYALLSSILGQEIESIEIIGNVHKQAEQKDVK